MQAVNGCRVPSMNLMLINVIIYTYCTHIYLQIVEFSGKKLKYFFSYFTFFIIAQD